MPNVREDYYETNSIASGRASYSCECCGGTIKKGDPSDVHKFYPEFDSRRTHPKCSKKFLDGFYCPECGQWCEKLIEHNGGEFCQECFDEVSKY
jgi:hypothetical protein